MQKFFIPYPPLEAISPRCFISKLSPRGVRGGTMVAISSCRLPRNRIESVGDADQAGVRPYPYVSRDRIIRCYRKKGVTHRSVIRIAVLGACQPVVPHHPLQPATGCPARLGRALSLVVS